MCGFLLREYHKGEVMDGDRETREVMVETFSVSDGIDTRGFAAMQLKIIIDT